MKPDNKNIEKRSNDILVYLDNNKRFCTKEELQESIHCGERIVRDCINYLRNKGFMIVSISSQKGYKLLTKDDLAEGDAELVKQMWCEIDNRVKELESMKRVCIRYWNYREKQLWKRYDKEVKENV